MIPSSLARTLRVQPEPGLQAELKERAARADRRPSVSVTDLIAARPAYWRSVHPVPPTQARAERLRKGRLDHDWIELALADPANVEIRARRDGIVGQVDILGEMLTELKTTNRLPDPERVKVERPEYVAQVGAYCALLERQSGRLVLIETSGTFPLPVEVLELRFPSPTTVWREVLDQADRLRSAWARHDPEGLPRCPWFGHGCEFQEAGVCGCAGTESALKLAFVESTSITLDPTAANEIENRLGIRRDTELRGFRFRELVFPRRSFYERTTPAAEVPRSPATEGRAGDAYSQWLGVIDGLGPGEVARSWGEFPELRERILIVRGAPLVLRTSRSPRIVEGENLLESQPQYFLDLALRCGALGSAIGRLLVVFEGSGGTEPILRVVRVELEDLAAVRQLVRERVDALGRALDGKLEPDALAACRPWMYDRCPYRARCGCNAPESGAGLDRFQR